MANIFPWLKALKFEDYGNLQILSINNHKIEIDFKNEKIKYPNLKEIGRNTTTNFSSEENFVVLEAIVGLLQQGYHPNQISIEKGYKLGHNTKSGNADITVEDNNNKPFLIIEAKTFDSEFDKEWNNTINNGGQLFSYEKQENKAEVLVLYSSKVNDEGKIDRIYRAIHLKDNDEYLSTLQNAFGYKNAKGGNDKYEIWKNTYQFEFLTNGVLEKEVKPYKVGIPRLSVSNLKNIEHHEVQKKYNEFATILRKYNIGGRENAFDKLVNLFLAKIVDEEQNSDNLQFNWKGVAQDTYFDLVDRLQRLYQVGMEKFLNEKVSYVAEKDVEDAFRLRKDAAKDAILKYFKELKYFSNNDFTFLDVYNKQLFYQNSKILVEIVQMLQTMKLKTEEQNQFLGDLFEGFLDNGVKQSEGQFFTPLPIVKFIISSLPINKINKQYDIPKVIDFACGAGHFLNEYANQLENIIDDRKIKEYYSNMYGIEKEYRLSKVAKVSSFMYGQDDINIIYGDALDNHDLIEDDSFSVVIANPPYSVKGFLETLSEHQRNKYELTNYVDKLDTNNSIELFFLERAEQLLKSKGVAGIIVPSSILSNGNLYIRTRKMLIEKFNIIAITEFGSKTFGSTGTNTIALFLEKKKYPPKESDNYKYAVSRWFNNEDVQAEDLKIIEDYCEKMGYLYEEYEELQNSNLDKILKLELFEEYIEVFNKSTVAKNILKKKITPKYTQKEKDNELLKERNNFIKSSEEEKIYYFSLSNSQKNDVVIVKSPTDNNEMKQFLGYEWSKRKGNEGIKYIGSSIPDDEMEVSKNQALSGIQTPLFDPNDLNNGSKINTIIRNNFSGIENKIPEELEKYVSKLSLVDMLDFSQTTFDAQIKTSVIKNFKIKSKYKIKKLENIIIPIKGNNTKIDKNKISEKGIFPVITQEKNELISGYTSNESPITDLPIIVYGDHSNTFKYIDFPFIRGADGTQLIKTDENFIKLKYLYNYLQTVKIENNDKYERHFKYLKKIFVPLPPIDIQEKIIEECNNLDKKYETTRMKIEDYRKQITEIFESAEILGGGV